MAKIYALDPEGRSMKAVNANTGKELKGVMWVDPESGEYEQAQTSEDGHYLPDGAGGIQTTIQRGSVRLVPRGEKAAKGAEDA